MTSLPSGTRFRVTFTKRDGTERIMNTIKGIDFAVTGSGGNYDPKEKGIEPLFDIDLAWKRDAKDCWRAVRYDSVKEIEIGDTHYKILTNED